MTEDVSRAIDLLEEENKRLREHVHACQVAATNSLLRAREAEADRAAIRRTADELSAAMDRLSERALSAEEERDVLAKEKDSMLVELERLGWPCRLVELPAEYEKLRREVLRQHEMLTDLIAQRDGVARKAYLARLHGEGGSDAPRP